MIARFMFLPWLFKVPTQTLPSFILSQQRQVCCGGMVKVQTDLMANGGWQGPHGSSPASRHPSLRAGRVSSLPRLFLPPEAPHWGILFCSDGYFIASSLPTPTPQLHESWGVLTGWNFNRNKGRASLIKSCLNASATHLLPHNQHPSPILKSSSDANFRTAPRLTDKLFVTLKKKTTKMTITYLGKVGMEKDWKSSSRFDKF